MKVRILPSSPDVGDLQHLVTFLVDGHLAIDAGCLGFCGTPADQAAVTSVFLTHGHADHVCSLPMFVMNVFDQAGRGVTVHAPEDVIVGLRRDLFNGRTWPDFAAIHHDGRPLLTFETVAPRVPIAVDGLTVTSVPVNHPVPTVAYLVDDGRAAVLFVTDTAPTREVWELGSRSERLKAAFVDAAFPDDKSEVAAVSGHLTPSLVAAEVKQLPEAVARFAVHLKPVFRSRIVEQLAETAPDVAVGQLGVDYDF